jgi:hypothetical protein
MKNIYRGPSIDAAYQVSVHLVSGYREDCLEINQSETRTKYVLALISLYDNMVYGV